MITYQIYNKEKDFLSLKDEWQALEKNSTNIELSISYNWCITWWNLFKNREDNTFGYKKQLLLCVGKVDHKIKVIIPLVYLERRFFMKHVRFVEFLGQQWGATTYSILKDSNVKFKISDIIGLLKKNVQYDIFYLRNISLSNSHLFNNNLITNAGCPQISLEEVDYQNFYTSLPKQLKQNIRTAFNRAKKQNADLLTKIESIDEISWEQIIKISQSKTRDGKYSLYDDIDKKKFYQQISKLFKVNFSTIYLNGHMIAYRYNILYNTLKFCVDAAYDRDYPYYNLGALSVINNIEDSIKKGLYLHSMGPGCYDYKLKFTSEINYLGYILYKGNTIMALWLTKLFFFYLNKISKKQL